MKKFPNYLIIFIFIILGLGVFAWQGIYLPKNPKSAENKIFLIKSGQGSGEIAKNLQEEGLIKSKNLFRVYALTKGKAYNLQAGRYLLSPSMAVPEIVKKFAEGDVIKETITIIEGWNLRDIADYLKEEGKMNISAQDFFQLAGFPPNETPKGANLLLTKDFSGEFAFLKDKPKNLGLEGYLFPDTYEIGQGNNLEDIIGKILKNFDKKLTSDLREEISRQEKSIFGIITMASILEKEVKGFQDKKLVSGILWKRLKNKMPLQVDATVGYVTGKGTRQISVAETKIDSPYNTYKYRGLPLGPISNPGLESVLASVYPEDSGYWYYISTPEGKTVFSKTFQEHNLAIKKYLR